MATAVQFEPLPQDIEEGDIHRETEDYNCLQQLQHSRRWMIFELALRLALISVFLLAAALRLRQSLSHPPPSYPVAPSMLLNSLAIPHFNISDGELSASWNVELTVYNGGVNAADVIIERLDASIWYRENEALASISPINPRDLLESKGLRVEAEQEKRMNLKFATTGWEKDQPIVDDSVIGAMAEDRKMGVTRFGLWMKVKGELTAGEWAMDFVMYPTCSDLEVRFTPEPEQGGVAALINGDSRVCSGLTEWGNVRSA